MGAEQDLIQKLMISKQIMDKHNGMSRNQTQVEPVFKYRWSLPNPGDPSSSLGAVVYHTKQRIRKLDWGPVKHLAINV